MTSDQRSVAVGAASGIVGMVVFAAVLYLLLPAPETVGTLSERIAYTLRWNVVAAIPLFVMLATIGNRRFLGGGIDPLEAKKNKAFEVDIRAASNTLEQNFLFLVGTLALSTFLAATQIQLIAALTITYVLARVIFWVGYRRHYLARAPGMAATIYLNLRIFLGVLYFIIV